MEQQLPIALQVALFAASGAIVVIAAVVVHVWLRVGKQLDRVVTAVEHVEAEIIPLAREIRLVVDRLRGLTEQTADLAGGLLLPVRTINRTLGIVHTGVITFLQALWSGRGPESDYRDVAGKQTVS
jgi:uncharacterized protein YoxC